MVIFEVISVRVREPLVLSWPRTLNTTPEAPVYSKLVPYVPIYSNLVYIVLLSSEY